MILNLRPFVYIDRQPTYRESFAMVRAQVAAHFARAVANEHECWCAACHTGRLQMRRASSWSHQGKSYAARCSTPFCVSFVE